jgi:glyoxylase-like metal-dependent hydrolase (beta-lactamase superfamily II)
MRRLTLGDFELIAVSDGIYRLDGGAFFGVIPKVMWGRKVQADAENYIPVGLNSVVVRTGKQTILIETGIGNKLPERLVKIFVINTHLHFDHCGWNTMRQGDKVVPTFPKAKYYAPEGEWQHGRLQLERDAISYMSDNYDPLIKTGQMELLPGDREIVPGISVRVFPGHTAHMQTVVINSGSKTACYISDLIPTSAHIDLTWGMAFDLLPLQNIESRKRYYAQSIPEKWLTMFTHDPNIPWAYVEKDERGKMVAKAVA